MRNTLPLLQKTDFPPLRRKSLDTLQANLGYRCNQSCQHCHVAAGPQRKEEMAWETMELLLRFAAVQKVTTLDMTGGAPELNPNFRRLVEAARKTGLRLIDRCNLTILGEAGQEDLADFLAANGVAVVASLPCYLEENVNRQRGEGVFAASLRGLRKLNQLGYGQPGGDRTLDLVYNPLGASLPPDQGRLEAVYKERLASDYGICFNRLLTLSNMPIQRFGSQLLTHGEFHGYMELLKGAHRADNLAGVMCRHLLSVDWQGQVYDCDFNQMLGLPLGASPGPVHLSQLLDHDFGGQAIRVADHCYGCSAGQGSSCGGALSTSAAAAAEER